MTAIQAHVTHTAIDYRNSREPWPAVDIHLMPYGVFTLPDTDTDAETDTDAIGFETHCVGVGTSVGKGKICVGVGQCEHTITYMYEDHVLDHNSTIYH